MLEFKSDSRVLADEEPFVLNMCSKSRLSGILKHNRVEFVTNARRMCFLMNTAHSLHAEEGACDDRIRGFISDDVI